MNKSAVQALKHWEQPVWKPARGQAGAFLFLVIIHLLAVVGLILFPLPGWHVVAGAAMFVALGALGTTVCYHRSLSHKTVTLNKWVEQILIFLAMFNGSGAPGSWVAYHRLHHAKSDTAEDISSPEHGGFWWAHLRWLYQLEPMDTKNWCAELDQKNLNFWARVQTPIVLFSIIFGLAFGWVWFFWLGAIRLTYSLHMQCFVNSVMHLGDYDSGDSSKNVWWLGPPMLGGWGENWHRNHHSAAGSAQFGQHWWQVDMGWYLIRTLEILGLASGVKRPRNIS